MEISIRRIVTGVWLGTMALVLFFFFFF